MVADLAHECKFVARGLEAMDHRFEDVEALFAVAEQGALLEGGHAVAVERGVEVVRVGGEGDH